MSWITKLLRVTAYPPRSQLKEYLMSLTRLSLYHYDVVREQCGKCNAERFHFVARGADPTPSPCRRCGMESRLVDLSDTAIRRLVTTDSGDVVIERVN